MYGYGHEFEGQVPECIHSFSSTSALSEVPLSSEVEESSIEQHDSFETSSDCLSFDESLVSSNLQVHKHAHNAYYEIRYTEHIMNT